MPAETQTLAAIVPFIFVFIFGTVFGSFGNVLIFRIPAGKSIGGRSRCQDTGHILCWWELIPLLSFAFLGGRSRYSKKPLSLQYPFVEMATGFLFLYAFITEPTPIRAALLALVFWLLLLITIIDARTQGIPDALNLPLLLITFSWVLFAGAFDWLSLVIGVGFLGLQWLVSGGKWVGSGDIILIASLALLLHDWKYMLLGLMLAYVLGSVVALGLIGIGKKSRHDPIAFAPFLVGGTIIAFVWGDRLLWSLYGV